MEQQANMPVQGVVTKTPVWAKIISVLMFLWGSGQVFSSLILLLVSPILGVINLAVGIILVAAAIGFWKMRKWALYVYGVAVAFAVATGIYSLLTNPTKDMVAIGVLVFEVLLLIYVWSLARKSYWS